MICFFPSAYPDELLYSQLSRYYIKSGYLIYTCAAEDLFQKKTVRPNMEFINALTPEAIKMITKDMPLEAVVQRHTMFPYYGQFLPADRKQIAFQALTSIQSNYHNLLPLPKRKTAADRYLRYCPVCVRQDREVYGETYWHRVHQMIGLNVCPVHGCYLIDSSVIISGKSPPMLKTAEEAVPTVDRLVFTDNKLECRVAEYMMQVFQAEMVFDTSVSIGQFLHTKMMNSTYGSSGGQMRNISMFHTDFLRYCQSLHGNWFTELWQIQKLLSDERINFYEICLMGLFLGISAEELAHRMLSEEVRSRCGANRKPAKNPLKSGAKPLDWNKMDDEMLPFVRDAIRTLYSDGDSRPRRVTVVTIERMLKLPSRRISMYLPKCRAEIAQYEESQEQYWAREVVWAAKKTLDAGEALKWVRIKRLTNMRKRYFETCLTYIADYANEELTQQIKSVSCSSVDKDISYRMNSPQNHIL
ncbi:MAG: TniQ family protein [Oscillospiraceae bacterium]|nr:TniQ family protein [Oscillospiraceae bacterium]